MKDGSPVRIIKIATHPNRFYEVVSYDKQWPEKYTSINKRLLKLLGPEIVSIEHIGSTSIPGMPAKPQIDVLVVVNDLSNIKSYYPRMVESGFTPMGDYTGEGEEYFIIEASGKRTASVHVLPKGHVWSEDLVDVRDYLLSHPAEQHRYAKSKLKAYKAYKDNYDAYYKSKLKVIQDLRKKAAVWKSSQKTQRMEG